MGDRANIILTEQWDGKPSHVYLYTHWQGYKVEQIAADGLREASVGGRADDPQYGGRIVTDVFLAAHAGSPHTGAGISAVSGDGDSHTVEINFSAQTVTYQRVAEGQDAELGEGERVTVTYAEFLAAFPVQTKAAV